MTGLPRSPWLARKLLERSLPADVREAVSGDLDEVFQRDRKVHGSVAARLHYWRTAVSFSSRFAMERWRDRRRGAWRPIGMCWLDVKLGLRMLVRYPGLSLAGGLGIAVVVTMGTAAGAFDAVINGALPFEDGERVVAIENWDADRNRPETRALHDFASWRSGLRTVDDVGAYRLISRNVIAEDRSAEPVRIAEISATAFRVARVPPLLGRFLDAEDELEGAPPVVVLGHDEWQQRFSADRQVVGRTLQLGDVSFTVVGVMPEGFGFPVNERYWIPLRLNPGDYERREGPQIHVFGRLTDGADLAMAQAELTTVGERASFDFPDTHEHLRPQVLPYTRWFFADMHQGETLLFQTFVGLLLLVVGANVAVLVYARTATRRVEIALRSALGASRGRIVGQMFAEGLALSAAAAAVGLAIASITRRQLDPLIEQAPFWVDASLMSATVAGYVLTLTVLGAVIIGVIPALQATGRRARTGLQQAASSGANWRIGRTYTVLTVVQVALAAAMLPLAASTSWSVIQYAVSDLEFPADEFLTARLAMDPESERGALFPDRRAELARRLESEPGISSVTFLTGVPGDEPRGRVEVDGVRSEVGVSRIGVDYFSVFEVPILAGRSFDARDLDTPNRHVIVNQVFAQTILGGDALGRRLRETGSRETGPGPWLEVVGVARDFPPEPMESTVADATLYYPVGHDHTGAVLLAARVRGDAATGFVGRLREISTAVDRDLQVRDIRSLDALLYEQRTELRLAAGVSSLITLSVLLLSATGLYALLAFAVVQRRREIGIRLALGANRRRILRSIFTRALWQLAAGIVVGVAVAARIDANTGGELTGGLGRWLLPIVAGFVLFVGVMAAAVPARRALGIQPTEALREP